MARTQCTWRAICTNAPVGSVLMRKPDDTRAPVVVGRYCGEHLEYFADSWARTARASLWVEYDDVP